MRVLLDTHVVIWAVTEPARLSRRAVEILEDPGNQLLLSPVVALELAIKSSIGRAEFSEPPEQLIAWAQENLGTAELCVETSHALAIGQLPHIHRDPFDRLLIAQARVERIPIVTSDQHFARYDVEVVW